MHSPRKSRFYFLCGLMAVGLSLLSYRLVQIQVVDRQKYAERATSSYKKTVELEHRRGMILDRNDEVIAHDLLEKSVYIDKYHIINPEVAARSLASFYLRKHMSNSDIGEIGHILTPILKKKAYVRAKKWPDIPRASRQMLLSRSAKLLIESRKAQTIIAENVTMIAREYHRPLGLTEKELFAKLDPKSRSKHVLARKGLSYRIAIQFEKLLDEHGVKCFDFQERVRREYKEPLMATHTIGVVNHKRKGVNGIEGQLDSYLKGRGGSSTKYLDARGYSIAEKQEILPPQHGRDVRITLDLRVQGIVEEELDWGMEYFGCDRGSAIVLNPHTGEVIAIASRPHYNLSTREGMKDAEFNFAIHAQNETGSTIKVVALSGALNEGACSYDTIIDCGMGAIRLPKNGFLVKDHYPYGRLPFWKVMQKSSNTGTYRIATMLGKEDFFKYLHAFGYGKKTGIELVGEVSGNASYKKNPVDFASSTYGYAISASPLQIATAYAVIANGGTYIPPRIIKDIHTKDGKVIQGYDLQKNAPQRKRVLREENAALIRRALHTVVQKGGTATHAAVEGYETGGKTGTNYRYGKTGYMDKEGKEEFLASFAGMCPIDKPKFVCVVVMDNPKKRKHWDELKKKEVVFKPSGGKVAGPMFARICKRIAPILGISPVYPSQTKQ